MSGYTKTYQVWMSEDNWIVTSHDENSICMEPLNHEGGFVFQDGHLTCWCDEWDIYKSELYPEVHEFLEANGGPEGEVYKVTSYDDEEFWKGNE